MKKTVVLYIILMLVLPFKLFASYPISKTNVDKVTIVPPNQSEDNGFIQYGSSKKEVIKPGYIALFVNGSIIKDSNLIVENDRTLLPIRVVTESLGAKIDWNQKTRKVTIFDDKNTIVLYIDNKDAYINNEKTALDVAPKIYNNYTYVPVRFVAESLNSKVDYYDGKEIKGQTYIVQRIRQVMVSRYPSDLKSISEEEALKKVEEQLIIAYEKRFGTFKPLYEKPKTYTSDEEQFRYIFANLKISNENDRYYEIPVVYDFWIDKYTGDVYTFYNGLGMSINSFDPYSEGALAFAG